MKEKEKKESLCSSPASQHSPFAIKAILVLDQPRPLQPGPHVTWLTQEALKADPSPHPRAFSTYLVPHVQGFPANTKGTTLDYTFLYLLAPPAGPQGMRLQVPRACCWLRPTRCSHGTCFPGGCQEGQVTHLAEWKNQLPLLHL